jgi:hypothetical protein
MVARIAAQESARRGHDRQPHERVARELKLARRVAVPAAESESGDADRRARAGRDRQAVRRKRSVDVDEEGARADDHAGLGNLHAVQPRDVEDDSGGGRVAAVAVPARARDDVDSVAARPADRVHDVADGLAENDRLRPDRVEPGAVEQTRLVVADARACENVTDEPTTELAQMARRGGEAGSCEDRGGSSAAYEELAAVERLQGGLV